MTMKIVDETAIALGTIGELIVFLWRRKLWWMIPLVVLMILVGALLLVGQATGASPFIYALF